MSDNGKTKRDLLAAAVIIQALKRRNRQTGPSLAAALSDHDLGRYYLPRGVRKIRDVYGMNALVTARDGRAYQYVLDPELDEGKDYARVMSKRILTEGRHIAHILDWLAQHFGNRGFVRRARRYADNLVAEVEALLEDAEAEALP